jgi:hypothetical protein
MVEFSAQARRKPRSSSYDSEVDIVVDEFFSSSQNEESEDVKLPKHDLSSNEIYLFIYLIQLYLLMNIVSVLTVLFLELILGYLSLDSYLFLFPLKISAFVFFLRLGSNSWVSEEQELALMSILDKYFTNLVDPPIEFVFDLLYYFSIPHIYFALSIGFLLTIILDFTSFLYIITFHFCILLPIRYVRKKFIH